ncbi:MAG: hypothetical protein KAG84_00080 [Bacteroidales bacterium]|nr:hypothetical protein [Bacteroidales bacterium]
MNNKIEIRNKITATLFILAIAIPFFINSLHFIIFEHNHSCSHHHNNISITENTDTHSICLWDFSVSDTNNDKHILNSIAFSYIINIESINLDYYFHLVSFTSLRAPPYSLA